MNVPTARSAEVELPRLGSKCGKWVERFSDFGKYKGNFRNHTTSLPTYRTLSKWGKRVDRLSDCGRYKGYIRNHSTSLPAYRTLSQVRGGSTSADLAVFVSCGGAMSPCDRFTNISSLSAIRLGGAGGDPSVSRAVTLWGDVTKIPEHITCTSERRGHSCLYLSG